MYNKDFIKHEKMKNELRIIETYCPQQYFAVDKCEASEDKKKCMSGKVHVDRCFYPCIHYFTGNCKYGFNCHFSHHIRRQITRPEPEKETCKNLYYDNFCPMKGKCRFSHDLKKYPCYFNTLSKCKFSDQDCRYSHQEVIIAPIICFFDLMKGCKNAPEDCPNTHTSENPAKYLSYDGPIN